IVPPDETIDHPYPSLTKNYHYEVELVAALAKGGRNIPVDRALDHVYAYTVGLDMTRRDLQRAMGDEKKPWEIGKSFDHSAPLGPLQPAQTVGHLKDGAIWLKVNGQTKQNANLNQMIWSVAEQISRLSKHSAPRRRTCSKSLFPTARHIGTDPDRRAFRCGFERARPSSKASRSATWACSTPSSMAISRSTAICARRFVRAWAAGSATAMHWSSKRTAGTNSAAPTRRASAPRSTRASTMGSAP